MKGKGLTPPALVVSGIGCLMAGTFVALGGCADSAPDVGRHGRPVVSHGTSIAPPAPIPWVPVPPRGPADHFGDGVFEPVTDIQPGRYKTLGPPPGDPPCYWARYKDLQRQITSIIASNYGNTGPDVVVIEPGDKAFESHSCGEWQLQR